MAEPHPDRCRICLQKIREGEPVIEVRKARIHPQGSVGSDRWFPTDALYQHADQCRL